MTYTQEIVSGAVKAFVWRRGIADQKGLWAAEIAMLVFLVGLLWSGERGWLVGVVGVVVLLVPCLIGAMWVAHHRNTVGKFRRMSSPRANFVFGEDGFEVVSELGEARLPWSTVTEIWERPGYWMLFTDPNQFMTLPVQTVSEEDRAFLRSRLSSAVRPKA
ncbi:YcxB family protein [Devosia sp.]|uniref:YcxB family protein n=1 Tax=Devosia sp. TaxID=1871048 RepID=UPI002AFEBC4C|nr:YcxB family protein [Devosia sp.]